MAVAASEAGSIPGLGALTGKARKQAVFEEVRKRGARSYDYAFTS